MTKSDEMESVVREMTSNNETPQFKPDDETKCNATIVKQQKVRIEKLEDELAEAKRMYVRNLRDERELNNLYNICEAYIDLKKTDLLKTHAGSKLLNWGNLRRLRINKFSKEMKGE
jgi:hypothetical protein